MDNVDLLANAIYGEAASEDLNTMVMVGSTILNRLTADKPKEFGKDMNEVLQKGYYAVKNKNEPYKQAEKQRFPDALSAKKFEIAHSVAQGLLSGSIKPVEGHFYFTPEEVEKQTKAKSFHFDRVKSIGKTGKYEVFSY